MPHDDDIVRAMLATAITLAGRPSPWFVVEMECRRRLGGSRRYVPKYPPAGATPFSADDAARLREAVAGATESIDNYRPRRRAG